MMLEDLLKTEFIAVVNDMRRANAPVWTAEPCVRVEDVAQHTFDVEDSGADSQTIVRPFKKGTASYVNGTSENPYQLRFVCFDEYLHQFVFDDGRGHPEVSLLRDHTRMADFIVFDVSNNKVWLVIHELSMADIKKKRNVARVQLSSTVNMLFKSDDVKSFVNGFSKKVCVVSAKDERVLTPNGMADSFMEPYSVHPDPLEFNFGVIKRFGFRAFETSKVILTPCESIPVGESDQ